MRIYVHYMYYVCLYDEYMHIYAGLFNRLEDEIAWDFGKKEK